MSRARLLVAAPPSASSAAQLADDRLRTSATKPSTSAAARCSSRSGSSERCSWIASTSSRRSAQTRSRGAIARADLRRDSGEQLGQPVVVGLVEGELRAERVEHLEAAGRARPRRAARAAASVANAWIVSIRARWRPAAPRPAARARPRSRRSCERVLELLAHAGRELRRGRLGEGDDGDLVDADSARAQELDERPTSTVVLPVPAPASTQRLRFEVRADAVALGCVDRGERAHSTSFISAKDAIRASSRLRSAIALAADVAELGEVAEAALPCPARRGSRRWRCHRRSAPSTPVEVVAAVAQVGSRAKEIRLNPPRRETLWNAASPSDGSRPEQHGAREQVERKLQRLAALELAILALRAATALVVDDAEARRDCDRGGRCGRRGAAVAVADRRARAARPRHSRS